MFKMVSLISHPRKVVLLLLFLERQKNRIS